LIHAALSDYGYLAAFLLVFAAGASLPSPGALVIVIAGALVPAGYFRLEALLPVLIAANVLGDMATYGMARRFTGRAVWERRVSRFQSLGRLERSLKRRPTLTVIASRFVPFVNGGISSLSGMCRLSPAHFVSADFVGNTLYVTAHVLLGLAFGRAWGDAATVAAVGGAVALAASGLVIAGVLLVREAEAEPGH
ncbi:MAG TPA: VTT domain-containing protein, partial [Caulobacteraceae bacterium]